MGGNKKMINITDRNTWKCALKDGKTILDFDKRCTTFSIWGKEGNFISFECEKEDWEKVTIAMIPIDNILYIALNDPIN